MSAHRTIANEPTLRPASAGREHTRWIQPSIGDASFVGVAGWHFVPIGDYYVGRPADPFETLGEELAEWRAAAAMSFWDFEDSLPEPE